MKDFVFIIPVIPKHLLTPVRQMLFDTMLLSLKSQKSDNWEALLIGDEEKREGNLIYITGESLDPAYVKEYRGDLGHTDKHHKIEIALQHIEHSERKPEYLIRLDDDDLISPTIILRIEQAGMKHDCYADKYQALYNVMNGKIALANLSWMANSIFHKYEHAIRYIELYKRKLINCSHNEAFHIYYFDKKVFYTSKFAPLYLRVLSETCLNINAAEKRTLENHTKLFGFWYFYLLPDYETYIELLINKFQKHFGIKIVRQNNIYEYAKELMGYNLDRVKRKFPTRS